MHVVLAATILFYAFAMPGDFRFKLDAMGFGVCHQISTHSFTIGGHQLPLCSRCSGMYLGAIGSLALLIPLRGRAMRLPPAHVLVILGVFFGAMVLDGINSTLQTLGSPIWDSTNVLRLFTGSLAGVAVAFVFYPIFNMSLWDLRVIKRERVVESPLQLLGYMLLVGLLVVLVLSAEDWLFYPIAVVSIAGMLSLLTMANSMILMTITRREGTFLSFSSALTPLLLGLLISLLELTLLALGRSSLAPYLQNAMGMPLYPGLP